MKSTRCTFAVDEQAIQLAYFQRHLHEKTGHLGRAFQLRPEHRLDGLLSDYAEIARDLFAAKPAIQWHPYIGHARSSQAACLNFMLPLADRPELLSRWVAGLLG